mgnify:CR=1 FL=1
MRMNAHRRIDAFEFIGNFNRTDGGFLVNTHGHHIFDAILLCTPNHDFQIAAIGSVVQMAMTVKKLHTFGSDHKNVLG